MERVRLIDRSPQRARDKIAWRAKALCWYSEIRVILENLGVRFGVPTFKLLRLSPTRTCQLFKLTVSSL